MSYINIHIQTSRQTLIPPKNIETNIHISRHPDSHKYIQTNIQIGRQKDTKTSRNPVTDILIDIRIAYLTSRHITI